MSGAITIAKEVEKKATNFLKDTGDRVTRFALRKYDKNAFLRSAMIAIASDWKLQKALETERGQVSLYHAMQRAAVTGLSLNPEEGHAAIVAYKDKDGNYSANYQIMKNGIIELALQTGHVSHVIADTVRENDEFKITHWPKTDDYSFSPSLKDRGPAMGYFAAVFFNDGVCRLAYMSVDEVAEHRDKYATSLNMKDKSKSPWIRDFDAMGKKTVLKRLFKNINFISTGQLIMSEDSEVYDDKGFPPEKVLKEIEVKQIEANSEASDSDEKPDSIF